ncbi:MAG TPA: alkaline phosphatase family protein [Thermoplasmata archaeon]|nr:alkaline phosphatase family protein [Thermoplasmata archaeon]
MGTVAWRPLWGRTGIALGVFAVTAVLLGSSAGLSSPHGQAGAPPPTGLAPCEVKLQLPTPICHVFVVFLENQEEKVAYNATFEHYLATHYAFAADYHSILHYSFPNYLAATAGYKQNLVHPMGKKNLVDLINSRTPKLSWYSFEESMLYPCWRNGTSAYRVTHNPFVWYSDVYNNFTNCKFHDTTFTTWNTLVSKNTVPNYAFFAPNTTDDCWRFGLSLCDAWLHSWLTPYVNASWFANSAFIVTYDEGWTNDTTSSNGTVGGGHVYTVAVSPYACKGYVSTHPYNHYDLFTTTEWLLDLPSLGGIYQDNWTADPPMKDLFCFPNGTTQNTLPFGGGHAPGSSTISVVGPPALLVKARDELPIRGVAL